MNKDVKFAAVFLLALTACSGGGAGVSPQGPTVLSQAGSQPWGATFRYQPATLTLSLSAAAMQFLYIDAAPVNGVVPPAQTFFSDVAQANPGLTAGACSAIATLSTAGISPDAFSGQQTPTVVVSAYPRATGTCTQTVQLGANGSATFSLTVTP